MLATQTYFPAAVKINNMSKRNIEQISSNIKEYQDELGSGFFDKIFTFKPNSNLWILPSSDEVISC